MCYFFIAQCLIGCAFISSGSIVCLLLLFQCDKYAVRIAVVSMSGHSITLPCVLQPPFWCALSCGVIWCDMMWRNVMGFNVMCASCGWWPFTVPLCTTTFSGMLQYCSAPCAVRTCYLCTSLNHILHLCGFRVFCGTVAVKGNRSQITDHCHITYTRRKLRAKHRVWCICTVYRFSLLCALCAVFHSICTVWLFTLYEMCAVSLCVCCVP